MTGENEPGSPQTSRSIAGRTMRSTANILWLGTKELRSFLHDYVLLAFVAYAFSLQNGADKQLFAGGA